MEGMEYNLNAELKDVLEAIQTKILHNTYYFGIRTLKCPMDFWAYQEIIFEVKPDVIIEIGNKHGGSTLGLAHILDHLEHGKVIGIDIDHSNVPEVVKRHPRITLITGDACEVFEDVKALVKDDDRVLVIEDSSHQYRNTLNILRKYGELVGASSYFIVEDGICHHGLNIGPDLGPYEAIEEFVLENDSFVIDRTRESFFITWNPKGFLKRVKCTKLPLSEKENISLRAIEERLRIAKNPYVCFSGGKKSLVLLHLMGKCAGTRLNAIYVDTGMQFSQVGHYVDKMSRLWGLNLIKVKPATTDASGKIAGDREACCKKMMTEPLLDEIRKLNVDSLFIGGSPDGKNNAWNPLSTRVNMVFPLAHFSDDDIREYIRSNNLIGCSLYEQGYSAVNCTPCSELNARPAPIPRIGTEDEVLVKEKLRRLGYL